MPADPAPETAVTVADAPERERYEAMVDGTLAGVLEYAVRGDEIELIHTEVLPEFEGRGIAGRIVQVALDDARRRGQGVVVSCPYVRIYLARHPAERDLVVARRPGTGQGDR